MADQLCTCGHVRYWHADQPSPGAGTCEYSSQCTCQRFQTETDASMAAGLITGQDLLGAERLMRQYMDAQIDSKGTADRRDVFAFHEMAGLAEDWNDTALQIAEHKALGQLSVVFGVDPEHLPPAILVETGTLLKLIAAGYVHGMTLAVLAAKGITDPEQTE